MSLQAQMLRMQMTPYLRLLQSSRRFSTNVLRQNTSNPKVNKSAESGNDTSINNMGYRPTSFDKFVLVWTKKYPNIESVPEKISTGTLTDSRSRARIKVCNRIMVFVFFLCIYYVYQGKTKAPGQIEDRRDGVDFHKQLRQDYIASQKKEA